MLVAAMAVVTFSGEGLRHLRHVFEDRLQFEATISLGGCLCCSPSTRIEGKPWKSALGQREYEMSGLCEACFDILLDERDIDARPMGLTQQGADVLRIWVQVRKAREVLCMYPCTAETMYRLLSDLQFLPPMGV